MEKIVATTENGIRTVLLNRPEKRNALDGEMLSQLLDAFRKPPDPEERVVVVRSAGPVFCAGIDLRERADAPDKASNIEEVLDAIETYRLPVVAVVQGAAIAGGNELALHCDFVVASERAAFGMSLAQIGLAPSWFLAKKLLEVGGPVVAREMLLLGDPLPAERMHALGIISRMAPHAELDAAAASLIDRLAANAPLSVRSMKQLLVRQMTFRDGISHEDVDALLAEARASADAREGIRARLERRPPHFEGH